MDRPAICPRCNSHYHDIHGVVYAVGSSGVGSKCDDDWHKGITYHPEVLDLTAEDRKLLSGMKIKA